MRLPDNHKRRLAIVSMLALAIAAAPAVAGHKAALPQAPANGPAADFPVLLGDAYSAGGVTFAPADTMNLDAVGYAVVAATGAEGGSLVSAAHHTLPVPSYVEVTSLDSGRTILVRVDRRGPMDSSNLIELSPAAAAQLGVGENAGVRVRRVNPPEAERALLRAGARAPERIPTPKALLAVLNRKLDPQAAGPLGAVALARAGGDAPATDTGTPAPAQAARNTPIARAASSGAPLARLARSGPAMRVAASVPKAPAPSVDSMLAGAGAGYAAPAADLADAKPPAPVAPRARTAPRRPVVAARPAAEIVAEAPAAATGEAIRSGMLVVQAGAFSVRGNAEAVASRLGARLNGDGKVWRVRVGPFASRDQAEAALAKVHAAGYSQARIQRAE
jgi:rare lipoprotein A